MREAVPPFSCHPYDDCLEIIWGSSKLNVINGPKDHGQPTGVLRPDAIILSMAKSTHEK